MKALKLPEKLYSTIAEVAERWQCEESRVWHYIHEGMLRPAIQSDWLDIFDLQLFDDLEGIKGDMTWEPSDSWRRGSRRVRWTEVSDRIFWWMDLPRFMYFDARNLIDATDNSLNGIPMYGTLTLESIQVWHVTVIENLQGKEYALMKYLPFHEEPTDREPFFLDVTAQYQSPFITREERSRFEHQHGMVDAPIRNNDEYTTPYIDVMRDAISNFFEPRHNVDAKSDEVESWIAKRLEAEGIEGSKRIASAMFTIIKPSDHNPRKRRG